MEWLVKNARNPDVERQHLNKILQEIKGAVSDLGTQLKKLEAADGQLDIESIVGAMVNNNVERGLAVSFNPQNKTLDFLAADFSISLRGDVTGMATVKALNSVTIDTVIADGSQAPNDGNYYWQYNGEWEAVMRPITDLQYLDGQGILVRLDNEDDGGYAVREIEGTPEDITVINGAGIDGNPVISSALLTDIGGGAFKLIIRDGKGRILGSSDGTTDDVPEGVINLYFTDERAQDALGAAIAAGLGDGVTLSYNDVGNAVSAVNTDKGTVAVAAHVAELDPHTQYLLPGEEAVQSVNGQVGLVVLDSDDIAEGIANLYFTEARSRTSVVIDSIADGDIDHAPSRNSVFDALALKLSDAPSDGTTYGRKDGGWVPVVSGGGSDGVGGVLPLVTGEIASGQPMFVYADDGSLIYEGIT